MGCSSSSEGDKVIVPQKRERQNQQNEVSSQENDNKFTRDFNIERSNVSQGRKSEVKTLSTFVEDALSNDDDGLNDKEFDNVHNNTYLNEGRTDRDRNNLVVSNSHRNNDILVFDDDNDSGIMEEENCSPKTGSSNTEREMDEDYFEGQINTEQIRVVKENDNSNIANSPLVQSSFEQKEHKDKQSITQDVKVNNTKTELKKKTGSASDFDHGEIASVSAYSPDQSDDEGW